MVNARNLALASIAIVVIIAVLFFATSGNGNSSVATHAGINASTTSATGTSAAQSQNSSNASRTLFTSTPYAPYSYVIYPGPVSQQAQAALSGFNITSAALQNGSTKVTLTLLGTNQSQSLALKPNYKLYIIEATFGDDGFHFDSALGDDGFVVVDQNGYVA